jgi:hypothetical protein
MTLSTHITMMIFLLIKKKDNGSENVTGFMDMTNKIMSDYEVDISDRFQILGFFLRVPNHAFTSLPMATE